MTKREWEPRKKKRPERWLIPAIAAAVLVAAVVVLMGKGILPNPFADKNPDNLPSYVQQEFLTPNPYSRPQTPLKEVNNIVIHRPERGFFLFQLTYQGLHQVMERNNS